MNSYLGVHKQKYDQISISAGKDVLEKMESKIFSGIGAALFFRALLTCIARIHLERLNHNGYDKKLEYRNKRKPSGHKIVQHFYKDIIAKTKLNTKNRVFKKWLESFDKNEMFRELDLRITYWSEVVHVEDPSAPTYKIEEISGDCELLLDYSRALITHPQWPGLAEIQ
jgi:hypothetical protein